MSYESNGDLFLPINDFPTQELKRVPCGQHVTGASVLQITCEAPTKQNGVQHSTMVCGAL